VLRSGLIVIATVARVASIVLAVIYPPVVYLGLTRFSTRGVSIVLLAMAVLLAISRARGLSWSRLQGALVPLVPTIAAGVLAGITGQRWALLAAPVLVNVGLLVTFAATLRPGATPMIERFARLQDPELTPPKQAHCRQVTWTWIGFFAVNAVASAALAAFAPIEWWATWCGGLAYLCIGALMAGEWVVRWWRFGRGAPA
jgi:uncharacterized membrane protein